MLPMHFLPPTAPPLPPTSTSSGATATAQATLASAHVGSMSAEDTEQDRDKFADKALHKEQVILERKNKTKVMTFPWFGLLNCTVKC